MSESSGSLAITIPQFNQPVLTSNGTFQLGWIRFLQSLLTFLQDGGIDPSVIADLKAAIQQALTAATNAVDLANEAIAIAGSGGTTDASIFSLLGISALNEPQTKINLTVPSIFNISGSPVYNVGTFGITLANQSANLIFAGPSSGSPSAPTFRTFSATDLPASGVTAGTYGDSTHIGQFTVDNQGILTAASSIAISGSGRPLLTSNLIYYVSTTGSDSNNGLTVPTAFLTGQHAINIASTWDLNGFTITIQFENGTYNGNIIVLDGLWLTGTLIIQGDTTTPGNVVFSYSGGSNTIQARLSSVCTVQGIQFSGTNVTSYINSGFNSIINVNNCIFGANIGYHLYARTQGIIELNGPVTIAGSSKAFWRTELQGIIRSVSQTITIISIPAFSDAFASAAEFSSMEINSNTYSGSATGSQYDITANSMIYTNGGTLPGSTAGSTATGGQFV